MYKWISDLATALRTSETTTCLRPKSWLIPQDMTSLINVCGGLTGVTKILKAWAFWKDVTSPKTLATRRSRTSCLIHRNRTQVVCKATMRVATSQSSERDGETLHPATSMLPSHIGDGGCIQLMEGLLAVELLGIFSQQTGP